MLMAFGGSINEGVSITIEASSDEGDPCLVLGWARSTEKDTSFFDEGSIT